MFNLAFAIPSIVILSPLFLAISTLISIGSGGSPIFKQKRIGFERKLFLVHKFRTMYVDAEKEYETLKKKSVSSGPLFMLPGDPRVTKIGRFLRKGFDEMPQLINVIKGDMDLVGPRPFIISESKKIDKKYEKRFSVNPGMTSPAILNVGRHKYFDEWMKSDLEYLKNKSIIYDSLVLLKTVRFILKI